MISINAQITYVLISFDVWKLTWKNSCKSQNTFWFAENVMTKQVIAFNWIVSWESFLSISRYFYEIAAPIRAETSVIHFFRLFQNTLLSSISKCVRAVLANVWNFWLQKLLNELNEVRVERITQRIMFACFFQLRRFENSVFD